MIVLDADILIAFFRNSDQNHSRAVELINEIEESAIITTVILSEILTFIKKRDGGKKAREVWEIIQTTDIEIVEVKELIHESMSFVEKYEGLSFGDATNIAAMLNLGIKKIFSFDADFDLIKDIERFY